MRDKKRERGGDTRRHEEDRQGDGKKRDKEIERGEIRK